MKKFIQLAISALCLFLCSGSLQAQEKISISKFVGAWEFVAQAPQPPMVTTLKIFDKEGNCTQLKVADKKTVLWQTAKIVVENDSTLKETIDYAANPTMKNTSAMLKYVFITGPEGESLLAVRGGFTIVNGKETFTWGELWRKVEPIEIR